VFDPAVGDRNEYDLRQKNSSVLFPSESYVDFLLQENIQKKIGAEVQYLECADAPFNLFNKTGDVRFPCHAIFIDTIQSELTNILKYRKPEHGSHNWELSQTLGLRYLSGYEHIRFPHLYVMNLTSTFKRLVTQTLSEPLTLMCVLLR
jgi:hypothetical protein